MLSQLREKRHKPCLVSLIVFTTVLFVLFAYVLVPITLHKKHKSRDCERDLLFKTYDNNNEMDGHSGPHGDHKHGPHGDHKHGPHGDHKHGPHGDHPHGPHGDHPHGPHGDHHHGPHGDHHHGPHGDHPHGPHGDHPHGRNEHSDNPDDDERVDKRHKKHHHHHHNKTHVEDDKDSIEEPMRNLNKDSTVQMEADLKLDRKDQSDNPDDDERVDKRHKKHHHHHHNKSHVEDDKDSVEEPSRNLKMNFKRKHLGLTFNQFHRKEGHKIWRGLGLAWIIGMIWQTLWLVYAVVNIFRKTPSGYFYISIASPIKKCTFFFFLCAVLVNLAAFLLFFYGSHLKHAHLIASIMSPMTQLLLVASLICSYVNMNKVAPMLKKEGHHRDIHRTRVLLHNGLAYFVGLSTFMTVIHLTVAINFVFGHWDRLSKEKVFGIALIIQFFIYTVIDLVFHKYTRFTLSTYLPILIIMAHQIIKRSLLFMDERLPFFIFGSILLMMVIKFCTLVFFLCKSSKRHKLVRSSGDDTVYKMAVDFEPPSYNDLQIESDESNKIPL